MCASTSEKKEFEIQFTKDGCAKGPNRANYANWVNNFVKFKADIRIESWDKIKDETKAEWWEIIKVKVLAPYLINALIMLQIRLHGTSKVTPQRKRLCGQ